MIVFELFEDQESGDNRPQAAYIPSAPHVPGSRNRALGNANLALIMKSLNSPGMPPITLNFLNGTSRTITSDEIQLIVNYYNTQFSNKSERANFVYRTLVSQDKMSNLIAKLKQTSFDFSEPDQDPDPEQLELFKEQEKSSTNEKYKDAVVQRAVTQARADFPSAASDEEAFIKSMMVQQDQDQKNIDRLKSASQRAQDLISKNDELDQTQAQAIDSIQSEIDRVEQDNDNLQQMVQRMGRANAQLQATLDKMRQRPGTAKVAEPTLGVSVATDKTAQPTPAEEPAPASPIDVGARQKIDQLSKALTGTILSLQNKEQNQGLTSAEQERLDQLEKKQQQIQARLQQIDSKSQLMKGYRAQAQRPTLSKRGRASNDRFADVPDLLSRFAAESATEIRSIPTKMVIQGYTVEYEPIKRMVTVSRRGRVVGRALNKPGTYNNYQLVANRIIDASEEDKYPDDLEARSVERPFGEALAAKNQYQLMQARKAIAQQQAQTPEPTPPAATQEPEPKSEPITLSQAQSRRDKLNQILKLKQEIETLTQRAQRKPGGIERGLAADLELDFPVPQTDQDYDDTIAYYQKLVNKLNAFLARKKAVFGRRSPMETTEKKSHSRAYEQGGRDAWYHRPYNNPYEKGSDDYQDYNRGFKEFDEGPKGGKRYAEEAQLDRSGQLMYKAEEVYMLTHNGREVAFYRLRDLKRAEQDAKEMQRKLGGEVHLRKVMREHGGGIGPRQHWQSLMRETDQTPSDDILKNLFKDFEQIFGKQPEQPKPEQPKDKEVKEGRAGYGPLTSEKHWHEVEQYLFNLLNDKTLDAETRAEVKQRYLDKRREAQLKGWVKK